MIICATMRCGGTIFCIEKAAEIGGQFVGELSPAYINGLGIFGTKKQENHETGYQPVFELDEYVSHINDLTAPDKLYLINNDAISSALQWSTYRIATRNMARAQRSMADLFIRSNAGVDAENVFFRIARICQTQLEGNILIRRYCELTGKPLIFYEDHYTSKPSYPNLDRFPLKDRVEKYFEHLARIDPMTNRVS